MCVKARTNWAWCDHGMVRALSIKVKVNKYDYPSLLYGKSSVTMETVLSLWKQLITMETTLSLWKQSYHHGNICTTIIIAAVAIHYVLPSIATHCVCPHVTMSYVMSCVTMCHV